MTDMHGRAISITFLLSMLISSAISLSCADRASLSDLLGFWKGRFNDRDFIVQFIDKENYVMRVVDQVIPGKYVADFKKNPIQLAVVNQFGVKENIIVEFIDNEHIRFQTPGPDKPFPEAFDAAQSFILRKVADGTLN